MSPLDEDELRFRKRREAVYHQMMELSISNDETQEVKEKKGQLGASSVTKLSNVSEASDLFKKIIKEL